MLKVDYEKIIEKINFRLLVLSEWTIAQTIWQIDGCAMGSPLSVVLSGIFMTKLEKDVVYAESPILCRRFVDDIFNRKKINVEDTLLPKLNLSPWNEFCCWNEIG